MGAVQGLSPKTGLVILRGRDAGLMQVFEAGFLGGLVQAVILDRGPVWFDGFGSDADFRAFVPVFRTAFPRRFGRRVRFVPEVPDSPGIRAFLAAQGFRRQAGSGYQTAWLDLRRSETDLRAGLERRWRNKLCKAEKSGISIEWDDRGVFFPWLMGHYLRDKAQRGYDGPSLPFMRALARRFTPGGRMLIGRVCDDNGPVAGVLFLCHGRSATYQVGWNGPVGRRKAAHNLLLWDGLRALKDRGVRQLDLGGMNDDTAAGVKKFKRGLGGEIVTLPGLYLG